MEKSSQSPAPPVDLLWKIEAVEDSTGVVLHHELTSPSNRLQLQRLRAKLDPCPKSEWTKKEAEVFDRLEGLQRRHNGRERIPRQDVFKELLTLGRELWASWVPAKIDELWSRVGEDLGSLLIETNEPWIPWEILVPENTDPGRRASLPFLCCRCSMARWFSQESAPVHQLTIHRALLITPDGGKGPDLPHARSEIRHLHTTFLDRKISVQVPEATRSGSIRQADLTDRLEQDPFDLLHFSGHGEFDSEDPDRSTLKLGRHHLSPENLDRVIQEQVGRRRPLVFLNACHSGRQGRSVTRLGGWPGRWIGKAQAGALIAPQWQILDSSASRFSQTVYYAWDEGKTLGEAVRQARCRQLGEEPWDSTPLAYGVYGHPNATIQFGAPDESPLLTLGTESRHRWTALRHHPPRMSWSSVGRWRGLLLLLVLPIFWLVLRVDPEPVEPVSRVSLSSEDITGLGFQDLRRSPIPLETVARLIDTAARFKPSVLGIDIELVDTRGLSGGDFERFSESLKKLDRPVVLADTPSLSLRLRELCASLDAGCRLADVRVHLDLLSFSVELGRKSSLPMGLAVAQETRPPHWAGRAVLPWELRRSAIGPLPWQALLCSDPVSSLSSQIRDRPLLIGGHLGHRPVQLQDHHRPTIPTWHPRHGEILPGVDIQARLAGHAQTGRLLWLVGADRLWLPWAALTVIAMFWRGSKGFWVAVFYLAAAVAVRVASFYLLPLWPVTLWAMMDMWKQTKNSGSIYRTRRVS